MEDNSGIFSLIRKSTSAVITIVKNFKNHRNEVLTATAVSFSTLMVSPLFYWPTTAIPLLEEFDLNIRISWNETTWIVQAFMLSSLLGPIVTRLLVDRIGRKFLLLLCVIPVIVNWAMIGNATTFAELCVARCIAGVAYITVKNTVSLYVEEIFSEDIKPIAEGLCLCMEQLGMLFILVVGPNIEFRTLAWILIIFPTIFFMAFMSAKETPTYLLSKNKVEKAQKTLEWLQPQKDITENFRDLQTTVKTSNKDHWSYRKLLDVKYLNCILIFIILLVNVTTTGMFVIISFFQFIINYIAPEIPPTTIGLFIGFMTTVPKVVSNFLVKKIAHRPLLLISSGVTILSLFVVSNYFTFFSYGFYDGPYMMAVVALFAAITAHSFGIEKVSDEIIDTIFSKFDGWFFQAAFLVLYALIQAALVQLFYHFFYPGSEHVSFWFFTGCGFVSWLLIYLYVPETKGLSLEEALEAVSAIGIKRCYRKLCLKDSKKDDDNESEEPESQIGV